MANAPSVQVTAGVTPSTLSNLETQIRKRVNEALQKREQEIERLGEKAAEQIIMALANGGGSVSVGSSSFQVTPVQKLEHGPIGRLLRDPAYIGEIGIPNPAEAIRKLKQTIPLAATYRARVFRGTLRLSARFNPVRLLKLNPHPGKSMPNGQKISIDSWLQWTTGPNFDSRGTPEYGLARVGELLAKSRDLSSRKQTRAGGIISASRTLGAAGADAGIMLKLDSSNPMATGSQFEVFTGHDGTPWKPIPMGQNFWNDWWNRNRATLRSAFREAASRIVTKIAKQAIGK